MALILLLQSSLGLAETLVLTPSAASLPEGLSPEEFRETLRRVATEWGYPRVQCTSLSFKIDKPAFRRVASMDGRNLFVFRKSRWCHNERCGKTRTFPNAAAAMTTFYDGQASVGPQEADVELNGVVYHWTTDSQAQPLKLAVDRHTKRAAAPLFPVLLHELGHVLGFQDTCGTRHDGTPARDCPQEELDSVMRSGSIQKRLTQWDTVRLCQAFPRESRASNINTERPAPPQQRPTRNLSLVLLLGILATCLACWAAVGKSRRM